MNQFELKMSYAHHFFTLISNPFKYSSDEVDKIYDFNQYTTVFVISTYWNSFYNNCLFPVILVGLTFLLFIVLSCWKKANEDSLCKVY